MSDTCSIIFLYCQSDVWLAYDDANYKILSNWLSTGLSTMCVKKLASNATLYSILNWNTRNQVPVIEKVDSCFFTLNFISLLLMCHTDTCLLRTPPYKLIQSCPFFTSNEYIHWSCPTTSDISLVQKLL